MATVGVTFRHNVKQKRFDVEIKRFMVEKQFGEKAEILTIRFVFLPIDFEDGNMVLPIDFVTRRVAPNALGQVSTQNRRTAGKASDK